MTLIAILIALIADHYLAVSMPRRRFEWYLNAVGWVQARLGGRKLWNGPAGVSLVVLVPVLTVGLFHYALDESFGLFGFAFAVGILFFCSELQALNLQVKGYIADWDHDDLGSARSTVAGLTVDPPPMEPGALNRAVVEAVLVQANERLLAVVFWFAVLGPMGAVLMRLTSELQRVQASADSAEREFVESARLLRGLLLWVPSRLTALGYAVTGSFVDALHHWRAHMGESAGAWLASNDAVLRHSGIGALQLDFDTITDIDDETDRRAGHDQIVAVRALVWRTVILWLTFIAVMTVAGWAA